MTTRGIRAQYQIHKSTFTIRVLHLEIKYDNMLITFTNIRDREEKINEALEMFVGLFP